MRNFYLFLTAPDGFTQPLELPLAEAELDKHTTESLKRILSDSRLSPKDIAAYLNTVRRMKRQKR